MSILSIFNAKDDKAALDALLETGKEKLIEAGAAIVKLAGDEAEGLTVTCTFTATVSRKTKE